MNYKIKESIIISPHEEGGIILDTDSGMYHEINITGVKILQNIENGKDLKFILNKLIEEYDIDKNKAETSILNFIKYLIKNGFIEEG
jgi:hypothetical protein